MTKEDIIRMARETRVYTDNWRYGMRDEQAALEAFANLVAKHEREECAKLCDDKAKETIIYHGQVWSDYFARAIRARGTT